MKKSTKIITTIIVFFLIIALVIIGRTMIGNHFKKKFSKRPPPGIIVTEVINEKFSEKLETFGTAISSKSKTFKIRKDQVSGEFKLKEKVKKGDLILDLESGNIVAPFSGVLGYTGLTEDIFVSDNIFIITLDDNSTIYSDIKIPESYAPFIKKGLPVEAKVSSYGDKIFKGKIETISSHIDPSTRSILSRIIVDNSNFEIIPGQLMTVKIIYDEKDQIGVPESAVTIQGNTAFVYTVNEDTAEKKNIEIGKRNFGKVSVISGLNEGDLVISEGVSKLRDKGKIKIVTSAK